MNFQDKLFFIMFQLIFFFSFLKIHYIIATISSYVYVLKNHVHFISVVVPVPCKHSAKMFFPLALLQRRAWKTLLCQKGLGFSPRLVFIQIFIIFYVQFSKRHVIGQNCTINKHLRQWYVFPFSLEKHNLISYTHWYNIFELLSLTSWMSWPSA